MTHAAEPDVAPKDSKKPQQTKIKIGKDTTHITGPLDDEGYVDYVAALNEHYSRGVTPENNAAVLFWRACGPREIDGKHQREFYKKLGIDPLPDQGDYYLTLHEFQKQNPQAGPTVALDLQRDAAMRRPWTSEQYPQIARWLRLNDRQLALIVDGTKRPKYYTPALRSEGGLGGMYAMLLPMVDQGRDFARALSARAMLRMGEGRTDDAWNDLLACHRLARLIGSGPFLVEKHVGCVMEGDACYGDGVMAYFCKIMRDQHERMQKDLESLPSLPDAAESIDIAERWALLDAITHLARHGIDLRELRMLTETFVIEDDEMSWLASGLMRILHAATDWNEVLRRVNERYDQGVAAARKPAYQEKTAALTELEQAVMKLVEETKQAPASTDLLLRPGKVATNKVSGNVIALLFPAVQHTVRAEVRAHTQVEMVKLLLAAGAYRTEHGRYPNALQDLIPDYIVDLPKDRFTGGDLKYEATDHKLLLYSVGPDQQDDKGSEENRDAGDVAMHLPPREKDD